LITGLRIPVVRAGLICLLFILSRALGRRTDSVAFLLNTLFILLLVNPETCREISFQLSFAGYASILLFLKQSSVFARIQPAGLRKLVIAAGFSVMAWAGTAPLAIYHFKEIVPFAPLVNLIVVPLFGVVLTTGYVHLAMASLFPILPCPTSEIAGFMTTTFLRILERFSGILPQPVPVQSLSLGILFIYYGLLVAFLVIPQRPKSRKYI